MYSSPYNGQLTDVAHIRHRSAQMDLADHRQIWADQAQFAVSAKIT